MVLEAMAPHDDLTMEELSRRFSYGQVSDRRRLFTRLVLREVARVRALGVERVRALDVGCGSGMARDPRYTEAVRGSVDELVGVEPDPSAQAPPGLFDRVHRSTLEDADVEAGGVHVAYAFMVMEHVEDPSAFLQAMRRLLHPQGVFLFLTPNGRHYFSRIAALLQRVGLDEAVLRRVRGGKVEDYHYPVFYRFNRPDDVRRLAAGAGFGDVTLGFFEGREAHHYFPGPLRPVYGLLSGIQRLRREPEVLLNLAGRLAP